MASSDILNKKVVIDGKSAESTLKELDKLVKSLNSNVDATGKKFSQATQNMNKMFGSYISQIDKILKKRGLDNPEQLMAISYGKQQSKQLNAMYSMNPYRSQAQVAQIQNKIAKDSATVFADTFAGRLKQMSYGFRKDSSYLNFDSNLYKSIASYRSNVNKAFQIAENNILEKLYSAKNSNQVTTYSSALEKLYKIQSEMVTPLNRQIEAQEKLQRVSMSSLATIQARLMANYAIINSVTSAFSYVTRYALEFDQELRNLQAIVNVSDTGLTKLKKSIIDAANATKFTSLEITKMSVVLGQAGLSVQQISDTIEPISKLATATGTDLATSTQTITSALNIYNLQADEAAYITNALTTAMNESKAEIKGFQYALQYAGNTAASLGVSFEETAAATAAMAQAGIKSVSTQGTGLRAVFTELIKPTKKFQEQLSKVGLTTADVDVKTKGFIPVLKTLKDAGFGVTEAYRGMERRGAAAMAAILSQIDFMDELTDKMSRSTAGTKAADSQMKGLLNTLENTKSILGSLAYEGFEPLIKFSQQVLETFNKLAKSSVSLQRYLSSLFSLTSYFGPVGFGMSTGGSLGQGIGGYLSELFGGDGSYSYDKAVSVFEEAEGKINKAKESYDAFANVVAKAYIQQERFMGPNGQAELDKFTNMIRTRFPQLGELFDQPINSFEELVEILAKATIQLSEFNKEAIAGTPEAARAMVTASISEANKYGRIRNQISLLEKGNIISSDQANNLRNPMLNSKMLSGQFNREIRANYEANPTETVRNIKKVLSDSNYDFSPEMKNVLESFLKEWDTIERENLTRLDAELDKIAVKYTQVINETTLKELRASKASLEQNLNNPDVSSAEFSKQIIEANTSASQMYEKLTKDSELKDLANKILPSDKLDKLSKYVGGDQEKVLTRLGERIKKVTQVSSSQLLDFVQETSDAIGEATKQEAKNASKMGNRRVQESIKNLVNKPLETIDDEANSIIGIIERNADAQKRELMSKLTKAEDKILLDPQLDEIDEVARTAKEKVQAKVAEVKASFDKNAESQNAYFKELDSAINKIKSEYDKAITKLEGQYSYDEGYAEGLSSLGLSRSAAAQNSRIEQRKRDDLQTQYDLAKTTKESLVAKKEELENSKEYSKLKDKVKETRETFETLKNSSSASAAELKRAQDAYNVAADNEKKYSSRVEDLSQEIYELDNLMEKLKGTIDSINYTKGNTDPIEALKKSFTDSVDAYAANNPYFKTGANGWIMEGAGSVWTAGFEEAETAMANFFDTAINGTKKTGDAFKDMCQSILRAMEQTLYTEIAKQFMAMMLSGFTSDNQNKKNGESKTANFWNGVFSVGSAMLGSWMGGSPATTSGAPTVANATLNNQIASSGGWNLSSIYGFSHGGMVTGGIANRDSVYAKLMPGEYVMKKSAVDALGTGFLSSLNSGNMNVFNTTNNSMESGEGDTGSKKGAGTLNIWVVTPDQVPPENSENIITTVSRDIQTNGSIKQLIKQVSMGAL